MAYCRNAGVLRAAGKTPEGYVVPTPFTPFQRQGYVNEKSKEVLESYILYRYLLLNNNSIYNDIL